VKHPSFEVINAGICGQNSSQLLARLESDVVMARPGLAIIGVGTNDAINSRNGVPLPLFENNLSAMADCLAAGKIRLLFLTMPTCRDQYVLERHAPEFFDGMSPLQRLEQYRGAVMEVANRHALPVADVFGAMKARGDLGGGLGSLLQNEENGYARDGVHPTPQGYEFIASIVYREMVQAGLTFGKMVCLGDSITFGMRDGVSHHSYPEGLRRLLGGLPTGNPMAL